MTKQADLVKRAGLFICAFLGIALQIQASIGIQTDYSGLRINLGDLILPFAGLFILITLACKKSELPRWHIPFGFFWPLLLTGVMTVALFHGRAETDTWSHWALLNKYLGWLVLMAYFGVGAWLAANLGNPPARMFLRLFILFFLLTVLTGVVALIYRDIHPPDIISSMSQLRGMMGNRNAYGFIILIILSFMTIYELKNLQAPFSQWLPWAFYFFLPLILVYNGSRIVFGSAIVLLLLSLILFGRQTLKPVFFPFFLGFLIVIGMYCVNERWVFRESQNIYTASFLDAAKTNNFDFENYKNQMNYTGDTVRLRVLSDALELWKQHPIMGAGLGTFLNYQKEKYSDSEKPVLDIIDTTPLWLLTETGLVGLFAFLAFYGLILWTCWKNRSPVKDDLDVLRVALLLILPGFAIMSLFHELLYARHLWFMLGMALAVPKKHPAG